MACTTVRMPGGGVAIVCGRRGRKPKRCACGAEATRECDWKVQRRAARSAARTILRKLKQGTCDEPLCERCTYAPAPEKDLCPRHAEKWKARSEDGASPLTDPKPDKAGDTPQADLFAEREAKEEAANVQ